MNERTEAVLDRLEASGIRAKIVPLTHIEMLKSKFDLMRRRGLLQQDLVDRYLHHFDFEPEVKGFEARSVIVTASRQPKVAITFSIHETPTALYLPPTYSSATDDEVRDLLRDGVSGESVAFEDVILPNKSLAAHSGLSRFGRNNVTYIPEWGSYFRLKCFLSDLEPIHAEYRELAYMDACLECALCPEACPTDAIAADRSLIHADRCLCYINEGPGEFPDWLEPAANDCIFGCMLCQEVCPYNEDQLDHLRDDIHFDDGETDRILNAESLSSLPEGIRETLEEFLTEEWFPLFVRNVRFLLRV